MGMMCPADEASLTPRLRRITQTDADDSGSYGQYSYSRYAFFLDRVSLSIKNGWIDNQGRVFIYYSIKNICEDLNCGTQKACKLLDELEKVGALERKRQGLGRPNKLYLKKMF